VPLVLPALVRLEPRDWVRLDEPPLHGEEQPKLEVAKEWLCEYLAKGPVPAAQVETDGTSASTNKLDDDGEHGMMPSTSTTRLGTQIRELDKSDGGFGHLIRTIAGSPAFSYRLISRVSLQGIEAAGGAYCRVD
jgi:hypothetical protein